MNPTVSGRTARTLAAALGAVVLTLATGCSSDDDSGTAAGGVEVVKKGKLTTCTHLPYPPFQSEIDGREQGFDVSLVDLVAKKLEVEQDIVDTPFENFKTGAFLNSGQCDLAAAGMTITEERKKNVDFSDPYFEATQAVLVAKGSGITSLDDVKAKGKKLGAQAQTTGEEYATGKKLGATSFESSDAVLNGLRTEQVDAVIIDYPVVQGWLKNKDNARAFEVVDNLNTGEQYGITVKKGNSKLLKVINEVIAEAKADGTYEKLYERWIGPYQPAAEPSAATS